MDNLQLSRAVPLNIRWEVCQKKYGLIVDPIDWEKYSPHIEKLGELMDVAFRNYKESDYLYSRFTFGFDGLRTVLIVVARRTLKTAIAQARANIDSVGLDDVGYKMSVFDDNVLNGSHLGDVILTGNMFVVVAKPERGERGVKDIEETINQSSH